jgi:hypothetical protein
MTKRYVIVENQQGFDAIKLTENPFEGIIYSYGKVSFEEDEINESLRLSFEYEIIDYANKVLTDTQPFEQYIGRILEELIHEGIEANNLTYAGGIDENRTGDPIEPDSQ